MILSDTDIMKLIKEKKLVIENFKEENLTPNGYDISVDEIYSTNLQNGEIPEKTFFVISTIEYFKFPNDIAGQIWIRTSWARKGVILSSGIIDAGFNGKLNLFAYNTTNKIKIDKGSKFAQVIFIKLSSAAEKDYSQRSGHYQGQNGIII